MDEEPTAQEKHELLLNHVVLQRFLPLTKSQHTHNEDLALMSYMIDNVVQNEFLLKKVPENTVKMLRGLNVLHKTLTPEVVSGQISTLKPGETFAMFVRRQNCALMIHMPVIESDRVIVATFPGNLHPKYVFSKNCDIQFNYPSQALIVPYTDMIQSKDFADQLCFLYEELPIETKNRNYVTKWLVTLLADEKTKTAEPHEFPVITKKIRDEILGTNSSDYFRRSSMYMCAKVFLQQSLTIELGQEQGKLLYKLIMIQFLTHLLDFFDQPICETLDIDLVRQCLAKLARRIEKLLILMKNTETHGIDDLYKQVDSQAKSTIRSIRKKIDNQIIALQKNEDSSAELCPLTDLDFEADVEQKVPNLLKYLELRKDRGLQKNFGSELQVNRMRRHYRGKQNAPNLSVLKSMTSETEICIYANDFEYWVLYDFTITDKDNSYTANMLRDWTFDYLSIADKFCIEDQLSMSKMILTFLKLIAGLDMVACKAHPLLRQYRTCIDPNIINSLLLPQQADMKIAFELEQYFRKRNSVANYPGLIEEQSVSLNSFSVKFAAQDGEMQFTLNEIIEIERILTEAKRREWQNGRDSVESLRKQISGMPHEQWTSWHTGRTMHDHYCSRCLKQSQIDRMVIETYEKPLPCESHLQNAVVFELECPIEIACLRDVLFCFAKLAENKTKHFNISRLLGDQMNDTWVSYKQISRFNTSESRLVQLGGKQSSKIRKRHVDNDFSMFVVENALASTFYGSNALLPSATTGEYLKDVCTLKTENEYSNLQWTLDGTQHTQNQVIARQSECDEQLSLSEFKDFGSLRADGHRLYLRKLYGMIQSEALSFEKSSVLSLVIQSLWEAGISGEGGSIRESHMDCRDLKFATAMIELLDKYCEQQKSNWVNPNKLLMATLIAVRVFEINNNETLADRIVKLLDKIRTFALDWIEKINAAIKRTYATKLVRNKDLHMKLLCVSLTGASTFFVNSNHAFFEKIFTENCRTKHSAPRVWLQFAIATKNNVLTNVHNSQLPLNFRLLLRMTQNIGIHIEYNIRSLISGSSKIFDDIVKLAEKLWSRITSASKVEWFFSPEQPQILVFKAHNQNYLNHVTIDIVTGEFLVNNMPVDHAPSKIILAKNYQRVFENFNFEVQPDSNNHFSTVQQFNDCNYEFIHDVETIIIERCNGIEKELIPHEILSHEIPHHLVENYSHFWNKHSNVIEFRPKLFTNQNFSNELGIEYRLDLNKRRLIHTKTKRLMLDINSKGYSQITKHLSRLELPKHIHIMMEKPKVAKIELIRIGLKFIVDTSISCKRYDLISNEFIRMRVSLKQKIGTLYGLQHGLLLESIPNSNNNSSSEASSNLLILPHGKIQTERSGWHVSVKTDLKDDLRSPTFHQYEIDEFCRQIKASNSSCSAWFYLAYLHAVTSHGEIEPFTGMSGTERALQILQSGFVWSSEPYDEAATKMLDAIAELTPRRQKKKFWQQVNWPSFIPPRSARDSFILITRRLLDDSQRLEGLHFKSKEEQIVIESTTIECNKCEYLRCLALDSNLKISDTFLQHEALQTTSLDVPPMDISEQTQAVSILYHQRKCTVPHDLDLKKFLMSGSTLDGIANMDCIGNLLKHQTYEKFVDLWISLYEWARQGRLNSEQFVIIWSVLAHEKNVLAPILALQTIEMNRILFQTIDPPSIKNYQPLEGYQFKADEVETILKSYHTMPSKYSFYLCRTIDMLEEKREYEERTRKTINDIVASVESKWPCDTINIQQQSNMTDIDIQTSSMAISEKLRTWNDNRKLVIFISSVEELLKSLKSTTVRTPDIHPIHVIAAKKWQKHEIDYKMKMRERLSEFQNEIEEARMTWKEAPTILNRTSQEWWSIYESIINGNSQHLIDAGLYPRAVPSLVLPQIAVKQDDELKMIIGAWAMSITHEQRQNRIAIYSQYDHLIGLLDREMQNQPHLNWKPCEYPEWLLFEIEQNLSIRRIQVEVSKQMIDPEVSESKHSVMQLNMGEGKTAVITPIVAAILADGTQACQITVLKSLFATNLKSLRRYLGGMLNRRVYIFPCRRDMPVSKYVGQILDIYKECMRMKGVILTLPEYRLSFQLKIYESIHNSDYLAATKFLGVHNWLNENIRNILDESDAILHSKYQLIYTLGKQLALDGGENRWNVIQAVFKRVPEHMRELYVKYRSEKIEYDEQFIKKCLVYGAPTVDYRADVFTPCRILDSTVYEELKSRLIEDFLDGRINIAFPEMKPSTKDNLRYLLNQKSIAKDQFDTIMAEFSIKERDLVMILSGLLRFEVLKLVLMKRWRVNYGVNEKGLHKSLKDGGRKMAIPFKAKDVAAEMTEFGHPDVALCFTQLSYYYSGLNDDQLQETFKLLSNCNDAVAIYNKWVESVQSEIVDPSIQTYSAINLSCSRQRNKILFPTYRFNMHVIDFYLSKVVYPREAKVFVKKLMCTTWDLCSYNLKHPVTGFSGTNDTKNILPMSVEQNDLKELESTNEDVRKTLLLHDNQNYDSLDANVSGKCILQKLVEHDIPVLLDAGALMLELNNEQVANEWLTLSSERLFDAAVYFDTNDVLQTIDRNRIVTEFDCSVYREKLNKCLVYLDDVHTRGTDLKFPMKWKACVTLSGDITRDKTVQACMRMRQLGRGQSIVFWASYEANLKIQSNCKANVRHECTPNHHVIEFICANSQKFETENTVHWAAGAFNYTKKLMGHLSCKTATDKSSLSGLLKACTDDECIELKKMYGDKQEALLTDITELKFDKLSEEFNEYVHFIGGVKSYAHSKIVEQAPDVKRFIQALDEEQERELEKEMELEEERHIERPYPIHAAAPNFDKNLQNLILQGATANIMGDLLKIGTIVSFLNGLSNTQLIRDYVDETEAWSGHMFVTKDFQITTKSDKNLYHAMQRLSLSDASRTSDEYLRPVWWIARVNQPMNNAHVLVILSSFECDRLVSAFRKSYFAVLYPYRPKLAKRHDNLLHQPKLQISAITTIHPVDLHEEVQIAMYSGSLYFSSQREQDAYCNFLGLIPRPRSIILEQAFQLDLIKPNGFVPPQNRSKQATIFEAVGKCRFNKNPVDLAIKLIEAHHRSMPKECHASSILQRGTKSIIRDNFQK